MIRTGQYINLFDKDLALYDAYVLFSECADELEGKDIDKIEEVLTPILEKTKWSCSKRKERCEDALSELEDDIEAVGWGYDVIVLK